MAAYVLVTFFQLGSWPVISVLTLALAALIVLYYMRQQARLREMAATRADATLGNFARSFDLRMVDPWIVRAVYEQLCQLASAPGITIPPRPNDDLIEDLELDPDDFEAEIWDTCCARTGRVAEAGSNPRFGRIITVRDVVLALQAQPISHHQGAGENG